MTDGPPRFATSEVEAHPAATVVVLRPGPDGLEVLLTRRPATMAFAADMHVFPGGRVDPADGTPDVVARSVLTPAAAAERLGGDLLPDAAMAVHVAAIREAFEEAGVLFADGADRHDSAILAGARRALLAGETDLGRLGEALDLRWRTDLLIPLSRWVTPPILPRRFDARFFAAALPDGVVATFEGSEVTEHAWSTPRAALDTMAEGRLGMWVPTSSTLQQLEHVQSVDDIAARLAPGPMGSVGVEALGETVTRVVMPAGGGVPGQPVSAYLVGRRRNVLVDPGDPTGPGLDRAIELVAARDGAIEAIALTHVDPDHAAGAEGVALMLGIPVFAGMGGGQDLPYDVRELADGSEVPAGDVPLRVLSTPGPRPDHLAFAVGEGTHVLVGDLDGPRGRRSIPMLPDDVAWAASLARLETEVSRARRLGGHPATSST